MGMTYKSGVYATLGAALNAGDTTITLISGQGARFNTWLVTQYDYTWVTVIKLSDATKPYERIKVRGPVVGDSIPVVARGQDGTSALSFLSGERVEVRLCAPILDELVAAEDLQTLVDVRAVSVGGTVNAITATHSNPLSRLVGAGNSPTEGMLSIFNPTGPNTSATPTYAPDGLAAKPIYAPAGKPLAEGSLRANMKAIVVYDASLGVWILLNGATVPFEAYAQISSGTLGRQHRGRVIPITLSPTISFEAAATLGADWWCLIENAGTGVVTLDPNGIETLRLPDPFGSSYTTRTLGAGAALVTCDGNQLHMYPFDGNTNVTFYWGPGSYQHRYNPRTRMVFAIAIGGGGGGGNLSGGSLTGGGGSGGYAAKATTVFGPTTESVVVGAGGSTSANGNASSFGSIVSATGGGAGTGSSGGAAGSPNGMAGTPPTYGTGTSVGFDGGYTLGALWLGATQSKGSSTVNGAAQKQAFSGGGGGRFDYANAAPGGDGMVIVFEAI